jgi:hypothetical protein
VVLSILCRGLGGFIYSLWHSGWFDLFCVGIWVVLSLLCGACVVLSILYGAWVVLSILCVGSGWFFLFCVGFGWFYLFYFGVWVVFTYCVCGSG